MNAAMFRRIVRAAGVAKGEDVLVHFWGGDEDLNTAREFINAVAACGASPVLLQQSREVNRALFAAAAEGAFDARWFSRFSGFDTVLDVFAYRPVVLGHELPAEQYERYRTYIRGLFAALMQAKRFLQIRLPTAENAAEAGLPPEEFISRMERAYDIDYEALSVSCGRKAAELRGMDRLTLRTGKDCELRFALGDRAWHIDAGDGDWPCGEVYIAPLETKTDGTLWFPELFFPELGRVTDVTLTVSGGQAVDSSNPELRRRLAELPPEETVVCELGFGMNPGVKDLCGCTVLDEKLAGSFHIALGANTMFGGVNGARNHLDLVCGGDFCLVKGE